MSTAAPNLQPLLADLLRNQSTLQTPVAEFADLHEASEHAAEPLQARHYKKLIPLSKPGAGEQYAFEVNLDQCTGCKACVAACHSLNGLDEDESWRDTGTLLGFGSDPFVQTVTSACHHCEDPACANGCPVLAYDKSPETGIVRHLDDQCIGCSYCMMKCPYDVPKFNLSRGIVRKCDMCHERLADGEAPACVQACPNEAIAIRIVKTGTDLPRDHSLVPGAFASDYTRPTTRYVSKDPVPAQALAADSGRPRLDQAHGPLAWMLVLTQMGAGIFLFGTFAAISPGAKVGLSLLASSITLLGIAVSVLHLGQPLKAWRAFLGWRKSWLSREIIAFGGFAKLSVLPPLAWWITGGVDWLNAAMAMSAFAGTAAVFCSIMVYVDTRRPFWSIGKVSLKFAGTAIILGAGTTALAFHPFAAVSTLAIALLLCADVIGQWRALAEPSSPVHTSARVMDELLGSQTMARRGLLAAAGVLFSIGAVFALQPTLVLAVVGAFTALVMERHQFFTACSGPRMTGN